MTAREMDRNVERLARRQHGVFSVAQARKAGATKSMIETRRGNGRWLQLAPSVYALPGNPPTWHRQVMAAHLALPGSAVSGLACACLQELDGCRAVRPELTVPRSSTNRSALATVHQTDRFLSTRLGPFVVSTVAQTLCDSAGRLGRRLDAVLEEAITSGRTSVGEVLARCEALVPQPPEGVPRLVALALELEEISSVATSVLELALYRILEDPRIPRWEAQATPKWWPNAGERVDAYVPSWRLIVEADGRSWHTRRGDFEKDRRRDHIALANGHRIVRFTHQQLVNEPDYVLSVLLAIGDPSLARAG